MESFEPFMDCLLHPAKCRVLIRLAERGQATAGDLAEVCPHISRATLYRYLNRMLEESVLTVAEERRVRGVTERVYTLSPDLQKSGKRLLRERGSQGCFCSTPSFPTGCCRNFPGMRNGRMPTWSGTAQLYRVSRPGDAGGAGGNLAAR